MVYVDQIFTADPLLFAHRNPRARQAAKHGTRWCHLWAADGGSIAELHSIAVKIGLRKAYFQNRAGFPHYDLVPSKRRLALSAGAVAMDLKLWVAKEMDALNGRLSGREAVGVLGIADSPSPKAEEVA
jgi:hypothetical protein